MLRNGETTVSAVALPWDRSDKSGGLDAGKTADALEQGFKETHALCGLGILRSGKAETHREYVVRDAAKIGGAQLRVALQQQACPDEQHHGKPYFQGKQTLAKADSLQPRAMRTGRLLKGR